MVVELKASDLQTGKYNYTWKRDKGDGRYAGLLDQAKVDKGEGYEVLVFIEKLMNDHSKVKKSDVHDAEDALHAPQLSTVVSRVELYRLVKADLGW